MLSRFAFPLLGCTGLGTVVGSFVKWSGVLALNYHRVGNYAGSLFDRGVWSADETSFDRQIAYLKKNFDVVSLADLPEILARKRGRFVLLTFDDGYRDNYTAAFPILRHHGVSAAFFVSTVFLDRPWLLWWDEIAWMVRKSPRESVDLRPWLPHSLYFDDPSREPAIRKLLTAFKRLPPGHTDEFLGNLGRATQTGRFDTAGVQQLALTWDMVREMRDAGMSIGGHTVTHRVLGKMTTAQQWEEISTCGQRLAAELGEPMRTFSYPIGQLDTFNDDTRTCLKRAGVQFAFSYYGGFRRFGDWDDYDIRRVAIESSVSNDGFKAMTSLPQFFSPVY